jgi:hypothetical protein
MQQQLWRAQTQQHTCSSLRTQLAANGPGMRLTRLLQMQMPASALVQTSKPLLLLLLLLAWTLPLELLQQQRAWRILQQLQLPPLQPQQLLRTLLRLQAWLRSLRVLAGSCLP